MKKASSRYLIPILILVLLVAGLLVYRSMHRSAQMRQDVPETAELLPQREVLLYFVSQDGLRLVSEARDVPEAAEEQIVQEIIQALESGSHGLLSPILPAGTRLLGYSQKDGTAVLDFSKELITAHPGGSMSELLTVYGLVNTLTVNFPHIRKVRILVDAQSVETLKGHVDLRQPIAADFRFARPSTEDEASTLQENR